MQICLSLRVFVCVSPCLCELACALTSACECFVVACVCVSVRAILQRKREIEGERERAGERAGVGERVDFPRTGGVLMSLATRRSEAEAALAL